jgi:hypothetical protein
MKTEMTYSKKQGVCAVFADRRRRAGRKKKGLTADKGGEKRKSEERTLGRLRWGGGREASRELNVD